MAIRLRTAIAAILCALLCITCNTAHALDAKRSIGQFHHTAWTVKQGAPGHITAMAQSADGYLWLGTEIGLFKFDGLEFDRYEAPSTNPLPATSVSTLYAPASGGLWIGYRYDGASFLDGDRLVHFGEAEGLSLSTVFRFAQDHEGTLWAATFKGLVFLRDGRWEKPGPAWKFPGLQARTVFVDASGTLWVATEDGIALLRKGQREFESLPAAVGRISQIAQAPDGSIWISEADGSVRRLAQHAEDLPRQQLDHPSAGLLFDRNGVLWASTLGEGIVRNATHGGDANSEGFERFRQVDGLSSDYLRPILEDREGNIWFGGSRGLDRFRHTNLVPVPLPVGAQDFAIAADAEGMLLVGTRNRPLMRTAGDRIAFLPLAPPITAAYRDGQGMVWLAGPKGIWKFQDGRITEFTALPVGDHSGMQAIAKTNDGALWVSLNTPGVYRLQAGKWRHFSRRDGMPGGASPLTLLPDSDGNLWMGFAHNVIGIVRGEKIDILEAADGLDLGNVTSLTQGRKGVWIGGERGLAHHADGRIRSVHSSPQSPFRGISGIVEDREGDLWLNAAPGVIRIRANRVEHLFDAREPGPEHELFDAFDGLPGIPAQFRPLSTAAMGSDGRLWFATTGGVVSINPAAMVRNPIPPPVSIRALLVDGHAHRPGTEVLRLPAGTQNLQITYTALSLSIPERVRFRFQLQGFDEDWQDAGTRRVAFYNDPGPGSYTFRVIAANHDGVWNEVGSSLSFIIEPRYYQTTWFRVLCTLLVLSVLWTAYLLRLRHLSGQIRMRLNERHSERERIARELHDTLLQGVQGLILRLHAAAGRLKNNDPIRGELETAMDAAEKSMAQGRNRVRGLRGEFRYSRDLGDALLHVLDEAQGRPLPDLRLVVRGESRALVPCVAEEVYMIGREALLNAFMHASAHIVEIDLAFDTHVLRLRIRDDGIGMAQGSPSRAGHWGLEGMHERADRIGATLQIQPSTDAGTEVDLTVPANTAYPSDVPLPWWKRLGARLTSRRHL